jgi:hypothetical protein
MPLAAAPGQRWVGVRRGQSKRAWSFCVGKDVAGLATSFLLHLILLLVLGWLLFYPAPRVESHSLQVAFQANDLIGPQLDLTVPVADPWQEAGEVLGELSLQAGEESQIAPPEWITATQFSALTDADPSRTAYSSREPTAERLAEATTLLGGGWSGRTVENRARLVGTRGGSAASEQAVQLALRWLAEHQLNHGGWVFDFRDGPCSGRCRDHGTLGTKTGATALALLPFLGAGHTPQKGAYAETVRRGIYYLISRRKESDRGTDFQDTNMYDQGLAAIVLCEAYGMSGEASLVPVAQGALDFICRAQHQAGGWRYYPEEPGDMTVTGWQLMALKSGRLAGLDVPSPVVKRVTGFLDSLQFGYGAAYGYLTPGNEPAPTAIGLLSRMYLGWVAEDDRLQNGADYLAKLGPSKSDMYFNYYAVQVLHHLGGPRWVAWNQQMRDYLIHSQVAEGHESGSWHFPHKHSREAGRLYSTAMCAMILEVYYRYLPLFDTKAVEHQF